MRISLIVVGLVLGVAAAQAQERVGIADIVRNDVARVQPARAIPINNGDDLFRNETVRTGADSDIKIVLRDDTNLSIGPNSSLRLDQAVVAGESRYRRLALRLTYGALRFVTGQSDKRAYTVTTPLATIGVRGTTLDILVQRSQTVVVLQDGQANVCASSGCLDLLNPGDTAIITASGGASNPIRRSNSPAWTFAAACGANPALCTRTAFADANNGDSAALCGR